MNVRVTLGRLTHLRRLLSHFVPGYPSIRRSSAFAGYQRRGRGRQSRACGTRHSCLCELSVRRRRASALCSPWHDYVHLGMAAWREAAVSHATALFGFPSVIMKCGQGASARREPSRWLPWPQSGWRLHPRAMRRYPRRPHPRGRGRLHPRAMRPFRFSLRDMSRLFCTIRQRRRASR